MNKRLARFEEGSDLSQNMNRKSKNHSSKEKFTNLLNIIDSSCLDNSVKKDQMVASMNKMGVTWKTQQ